MMELNAESLLNAYRSGLFPMAESRKATVINWICPRIRGILPLNQFHLPKRLKRKIKTWPHKVLVNQNFKAVIEACAAPRSNQHETWINDEIIAIYCEIHALGFAHSIECWSNEKLIGGLYGIAIGGAFFGESMFSLVTDASKVALVHLVARLNVGSYKLLDIQFTTSHLECFGAMSIPHHQYIKLLKHALTKRGDFYSLGANPDSNLILQSITQTS